MVEVTRHGEPSQPAKYQNPKIEIEHIYADCDVVDNETSRLGKHGGTNQHGKSSAVSRYQQPRKTSKHANSENNSPTVSRSKDTLLSSQEVEASNSSNYQYPNPDRSYIDMSLRKETKGPTGSMVTSANHQLGKQSEKNKEYQHPRVDQQSNSVVQPEYEESSTTNHDQLDAYGIMSDYQHPKPSIEHTGCESRLEEDGNSVLPSELQVPLTNNHLHEQGESSSAPSEYQYPKPSNEQTGRERRVEEDGNSVLLSSELQVPLNTHLYEQDESSSVPSEYQHPKPSLRIEHTGSEDRADQKENSVPPSKCGPTSRTEQVDHTVDKRKEDTPSKPPRYSKPAAIPPKAPSTKSSSPPTKLAPPSAMLVTPPSDQFTEDKSREDNYLSPDVKFWTSESGDQSDKNESGSIDVLSAGESLPTASMSQSPSPRFSGDGNSICEASYQMPEIQFEFFESKGYSLPQPPLSAGNNESNLGYHIPEVDTEFLESGDNSLIQPSTSPPVLPPKRPIKKSLSSKLFMAPATSTPPTLPARSLSQRSSLVSKFSTSSKPPVLPPKTSSLKFPRIRQTAETSGLSPPALPSKAPSQKSPSATSSSPPTLPPRKQSVKSPETEAPQSPMPPPVSPKAAPLLPAETKPVSPPPSTQYAELNELHRQYDDTENYQHLIQMQNIK